MPPRPSRCPQPIGPVDVDPHASLCFPGTYVTRAEATDADDPETDNAALRFSILQQGGPELFSIDELTGEIRTVQVGLDREVRCHPGSSTPHSQSSPSPVGPSAPSLPTPDTPVPTVAAELAVALAPEEMAWGEHTDAQTGTALARAGGIWSKESVRGPAQSRAPQAAPSLSASWQRLPASN